MHKELIITTTPQETKLAILENDELVEYVILHSFPMESTFYLGSLVPILNVILDLKKGPRVNLSRLRSFPLLHYVCSLEFIAKFPKGACRYEICRPTGKS